MAMVFPEADFAVQVTALDFVQAPWAVGCQSGLLTLLPSSP